MFARQIWNDEGFHVFPAYEPAMDGHSCAVVMLERDVLLQQPAHFSQISQGSVPFVRQRSIWEHRDDNLLSDVRLGRRQWSYPLARVKMR